MNDFNKTRQISFLLCTCSVLLVVSLVLLFLSGKSSPNVFLLGAAAAACLGFFNFRWIRITERKGKTPFVMDEAHQAVPSSPEQIEQMKRLRRNYGNKPSGN